MAATYRSSSNAGTSGDAYTATEPAGAASGDLLVAFFEVDNNAAVPALPGGWTERARGGAEMGSGFNFRWVIGTIVRGGSAPNLTFTYTGGTGFYREYNILAFSGGAELDAFITQAHATATQTADPPANTNSVATCIALAFGYNRNGWSGTPTAPSGYTLRSGSNGLGSASATKAISSIASEDPGTFQTAIANDDSGGMTMFVRDADSIPVSLDTPNLLGPAAEGATMACNPGNWYGNVTGYLYQWQNAGVDISGETSQTYVVQAGDVGDAIRCEVIAQAAGADSAPVYTRAVTVTAAGTPTDAGDGAELNSAWLR